MSVEVVGSLAYFLAGFNQLAVFPLLCWVNLEVEAATKLCHKSRLASTRIRILMPIKALRPQPRALPRPLGQAVAGNWFLAALLKLSIYVVFAVLRHFHFHFHLSFELTQISVSVTGCTGWLVQEESPNLFTCSQRTFTCFCLRRVSLSLCVYVFLSLWVSLCVCIPLSPCVCVFVVVAWPTTTRKTPPSCVVSSGEFRWGEVVVDITEVLVALPQTGLPLSHSLALPANYPALSLFLAHSPTLSLFVPAHARLAWPRRQRDKTSFSCERIFVARGRRCAQRKNPLK